MVLLMRGWNVYRAVYQKRNATTAIVDSHPAGSMIMLNYKEWYHLSLVAIDSSVESRRSTDSSVESYR